MHHSWIKIFGVNGIIPAVLQKVVRNWKVSNADCI